jgi:hypothetical protein
MRNIIHLLLCIIIIGCQSIIENTDQETNLVKAEKQRVDNSSDIQTDEGELSIVEREKKQIDKVLLQFFKLIVLEQIRPEFSLNEKNYLQIDIDKYLRQLDSIDLFDSSFYLAEQKRLQPCIDDLDTMQATINEANDGIWAPRTCFSDYLYWLNAQDEPESYSFSMDYLEKDNAVVIMKFLSIYDGKSEVWDNVKIRITLNKKDNEYKIAGAEMINLNK